MTPPDGGTPQTPALVVEGLAVKSVDNGALLAQDVSISLAAGQILGLVGESGSGKTTTGLACLGHTKPGTRISAGKVMLEGRNLLEVGQKELHTLRRTRLSYVPQAGGFSLNPALRLRTQLIALFESGTPRASRKKRILDMLGRVALPASESFLRRYPHQLSGGQQQRVVIAAAILCRPSVLVLDEPTTGLDVTTQAQIVSLVSELCREDGVAAIFITHDLSLVSEICDRIAVMYAGRLVETGPIREVLQRPAHPYTRRLLQSVPDIAGGHPLVGLPGRPPVPGRSGPGCSFAPRCSAVQARCHEASPPKLRVNSQIVECFFPVQDVQHRPASVAAGEDPPQVGAETPQTPTAIVDLTVTKAFYGRNDVLRDIHLAFPEGSCTGIVGESGSGKTTLSRIIAGLHHEYDGQVLLETTKLEAKVSRRTELEKYQLQYIFQNPYDALNPRRKIWESLIQPIRHLMGGDRAAKERATVLLDSVGLGPQLADRYPVELSGGQLQRVAIARALATEPTMLICDEVTSALDVSVQASIVGLLKDLQRARGLTIIFVTHNVSLVRYVADTMVVLKDGAVLEHASTTRVMDDPKDPYTQSLIAAVPDLWRKIDDWEGGVSHPRNSFAVNRDG